MARDNREKAKNKRLDDEGTEWLRMDMSKIYFRLKNYNEEMHSMKQKIFFILPYGRFLEMAE